MPDVLITVRDGCKEARVIIEYKTSVTNVAEFLGNIGGDSCVMLDFRSEDTASNEIIAMVAAIVSERKKRNGKLSLASAPPWVEAMARGQKIEVEKIES